MLKVRHSGPRNGKLGYIKIYQDKKLIVYIECNYFSPYQYAIQHKMGWFAKAIREALLNAGVSIRLCDYLLKTGKYDPRNEEGYSIRPNAILSRTRSRNAKKQHEAARIMKRNKHKS